LGKVSDGKTIFGHHRTRLCLDWAAVFTALAFIALQVVWQLGLSIQTSGWNTISYAWIALLALIFALYGLALSASSTPLLPSWWMCPMKIIDRN
jgi:BCD family chlorophyll transporter-like MFS transporter